jgi:hypothetical protein
VPGRTKGIIETLGDRYADRGVLGRRQRETVFWLAIEELITTTSKHCALTSASGYGFTLSDRERERTV